MLRRFSSIVLVVALLAACGQKGPLVLPEETRARPVQPPAHDVPPVEERKR